jgi:YbbR domain-containing protein
VEIVRKNFGLKVLAVGLALVGWAYVRFASNPIVAMEQYQQLSIPIIAVNLPLDYVARYTDRQAVVTVSTKRGEPAVKPEEIKAVLDLSNKAAGVYNVPVQLVAPHVAIQSLSPASVTLTIEQIEERSVPVSAHYVGAQPGGIVVSDTQIQPDSAIVRAPASLIEQVSGVYVDVALPNQPKVLDEMVRPVPFDSSGAELTDLSVTPNLVRVKIRFVAGSGVQK